MQTHSSKRFGKVQFCFSQLLRVAVVFFQSKTDSTPGAEDIYMATLLRSASTTRTWFLNLNRETRSVIVAYFLVVVLIVFGGLLVTPNFFSPEFLLQQLREASFLGIIAAGQITVI